MKTTVLAFLTSIGLVFASGAALAGDQPPSDSKRLSEIALILEKAGYHPISEIEFDDGHWEVDAYQNGVKIECCIACPTTEIIADHGMLEQVLLNVMHNGIDAMTHVPPAQRTLRLDLSASEEQYTLRISDRGCGISPEVQEKLFSPFFTTKPSGMGMGLNICRSIIEFHHGRLWAEDNPAGGATFVIVLPKMLPKDTP